MKFIRRSLTWEVKTTIATSLQPWLLLLLPLSSPAASLCVNVNNNAGAAYPYSSWATAATNIQDAVDAAAAGDTVYVTNGVYTLGGKAMAGDLTNRVTLDKALTVQSVNGPLVTAIQGAGATNSTTAVRCAWLTNGASLVGFTLQGGATRLVGDTFTLRSGGAVWGSSTSASVLNCLVISNAAAFYGAAGFQAALINCAVIGNNSAAWVLYSNILKSCTVVSNYGGGTYQCAATNSIIQYNTPGNYAGGAYANCCSSPTPPGGSGNISSAPQLLFDGIHLSATSPCIGAGGYFTAGTDIDGQPWAAPPSIGCDEWKPDPVIITKPTFKLTSDPVGFSVGITVVGQAPFYCWWTRNGSAIEDDGHYSASHATNLVATGIALSDPGAYQVVVSNTAGVATSAVTQLVFHYANPANASSSSPYTTWSAAATNLQDAITAASPGDIILATNGTYATGGKAMVGDLTNRVTLDKPLLLVSVNGPGTTTIQGAYDPASTNGPNAVRCAWLTNNAILSGFTLCSGATRDVTVFVDGTMSGGGVCGSSVSAVVDHCLVVSNYASYPGGGAYRTSLNYCQLVGNRAVGSGMAGAGVAGAGTGGGAAWCNLKNCVVTANYADQGNGGGADTCNLTNCALTGNSSYMNGGGANAGSLLNCTVSGNISSGYTPGYGGAIYGATVTNCILWGNRQRTSNTSTNYASCTLDYCCSSPLSTGTGNIALDPQLLVDGFHLAEASPCHGAGRAGVIIG
ncbi:MAG: hypothetical protein NT167_28835, partial [Verrucomicrobia bacterium]|nr:hypothetical protein [Verrucomicrobiota bacterium]